MVAGSVAVPSGVPCVPAGHSHANAAASLSQSTPDGQPPLLLAHPRAEQADINRAMSHTSTTITRIETATLANKHARIGVVGVMEATTTLAVFGLRYRVCVHHAAVANKVDIQAQTSLSQFCDRQSAARQATRCGRAYFDSLCPFLDRRLCSVHRRNRQCTGKTHSVSYCLWFAHRVGPSRRRPLGRKAPRCILTTTSA